MGEEQKQNGEESHKES